MSTPVTVSPQWVRGAVVAGQHIPAPTGPSRYRDAADVLRGTGLIQLDPLTRVSTAQRLTCLTRLPATHRAEDVDPALWPGPPSPPAGFEGLTKVACVFPVEDWPLLAQRRHRIAQRSLQTRDPAVTARIAEVVAAHPGGATIGMIEQALGSERTTGWNWTHIKSTAEAMVGAGELVITARRGIARLLELPHRGLPPEVLSAAELPDEELLAQLARRAASTLGVMTVADFAHHYHLPAPVADAAIHGSGLVPVQVHGWKDTAYVLAETLEERLPGQVSSAEQPSSAHDSASGAPPAAHARLIGPFDPLLRDRKRALRIFDFDYRFEAYVPVAKRVYGHYVMAVLDGDQLIGRVDVQRVKSELWINGLHAESGYTRRHVRARARAGLRTLAQQLGAAPLISDEA